MMYFNSCPLFNLWLTLRMSGGETQCREQRVRDSVVSKLLRSICVPGTVSWTSSCVCSLSYNVFLLSSLVIDPQCVPNFITSICLKPVYYITSVWFLFLWKAGVAYLSIQPCHSDRWRSVVELSRSYNTYTHTCPCAHSSRILCTPWDLCLIWSFK